MRDLLHSFDIYLVNVKTIRKIAQIFVAFSEKLNFKGKIYMLNDGDYVQPCHKKLGFALIY